MQQEVMKNYDKVRFSAYMPIGGAANVLARQHAIAAFAPVRYFHIRSSGNVCTSEEELASVNHSDQ